jgi:hypothetical protein
MPVSEESHPDREGPDRRALRTPVILVLLVVVGLEFLGVVSLAVVLIIDLFVAHASSVAGGIALAVLAIVAAIWVGAIWLGLTRGRSWVRSGIIVWQFLMIAIAVGAFEGVFREPAIGWALLVPALVALGLVLSPPATRVLARREP